MNTAQGIVPVRVITLTRHLSRLGSLIPQLAILAWATFWLNTFDSLAQDPLNATAKTVTVSQRIDQLLVMEPELLTAPEAAAGQLLRRLSLDLRGVVPTREELDAFVAAPSPERWSMWVGVFLTDPLCDEHLVTFLDRTLMLRRPHAQVDRASWLAYLREHVAADLPLDTLAKQLLFAPWWNRDHRPAQKFFLDRGGDPNLIARDIGRVFLGRDMQCAQCHDHPIVDDYKQIDYYGLLAYVSTSGLVETPFKDAEGKDQKVQLYVERAAGDAPFESVFDKGVPFRSGPRLIYQSEQFEEYLMPDARNTTEAPTGALSGVAMPPKVSRRQALAEQLATRSNRAFVANWANRLWSLAFGQGLVQPLDMHHPHNPPSNPQLFELITDELLEVDMRPRKFLEQLVLSQAYRRGSLLPVAASGTESTTSIEVATALRTGVATKLADARSLSTSATAAEAEMLAAYDSALAGWRKVQGDRAAIRTQLDAAEAAILVAKKNSTDAAAACAAAVKRQADNQSRISLLDESAAKLQQVIDLAGKEDAELNQAVVLAKQRAEAARATVPEVDKAVSDTKTASDATAPPLAETTVKVGEIVAKLQPIQQSLSAADVAMIETRTQWSKACSARKSLNQAQQRYEQSAAWLDTVDAAGRLAGEASNAKQSLIAIESEMPAAVAIIASLEGQLSAAQQAEQAAASELTKAIAALDQNTSELAQFQQTSDSLVASAKLVSTAEALTITQQTIQTEIETWRTMGVALQALHDTDKQTAAAAGTMVAMRQQELATQQTAAKAIQDRIAVARDAVTAKETELAAANTTTTEKFKSIEHEASRQLATAALQPLTPEQLCWSTLRVTGVLDAYIRTEAAELEKATPLAVDADATTKALRHRQAVRQGFDKLRGHADAFVSLYASGPDKTEDDFFASADQALFTANAGSVYAWAGPGNDNVTQKAIAMTDNAQIAQMMYWTLLCRPPTAEESQLISEQIVASGENRNAVIQEMVWGLLASVEFRFVN